MTQQQWFVVRAGKEEGPLSGQRLKEMAADGRLRPDDLVRRADVETARPARAVKGLFPGEGAGNPARASTASTECPPPASQRSLRGGGASVQGKGGTRRRWVIPSVVAAAIMLTCCGGFSVIGYFGVKMKDAAQREVADADALWDRGEKALAVEKYRGRLGANSTFLKAEDKPRVYGRVVDYDVERGDVASATAVFAEAAKNKVTPQVSHPQARAMVAEREAEESRAEAAKRSAKADAERAKEAGKQEKPDAESSDGPVSTKVSKGTFSGSLELRVLVPDEITVSDPSLDRGTINFRLHWKKSIGRPRDPWHYSAYGKDGVKIDGGAVGIPDAMELGQKVKARIVLRSGDVKEITRIDIHQ